MSLRSIAHDAELPLTDHLGELRTRLIICVSVLTVAFGVGLWQSRALLTVLNRPLASVSQHDLGGPARTSDRLNTALTQSADAFAHLSRSRSISPPDRHAVAVAARSLQDAAHAPRATNRPITLGLGEPFSTSIMVAFAFALLLALPILLSQLYAFVIPAVPPELRGGLRPLLLLAPALFLAGAAFAYVLVLPPAVRFLQGFNHGAFDTFVQARDYYKFELTTIGAVALIFELPVLLLGLARAGLVHASWLRRKRRIAIVALAALAAALPGTDPVTTLLELVPLLALYELGILLVAVTERRERRRAAMSAA